MPFLKYCPKPKRTLPISTLYLADPVQKVHLRVTASMELQKNVFTFYPRKPNLSIMNFHEIPVTNTLDATIFKLHLKCWVNMCLFNTLDAHFFLRSNSKLTKEIQKNVRKFRHLTYFLPTATCR